MQKVLIVDDEPKITEVIAAYLAKSGYAAVIAADGRQALNLYASENPDMIILDLMLPFISGEDICRQIRQKSNVPIIMVTAKANEDSKVSCLNMGADDYITKPFSPRELVARVNSLFRRCLAANGGAQNKISVNSGALIIDFDAHTASKPGEIIPLTPNEFKLLSVLAKHPNKTFTREELIENAFGLDFAGFDRTIDSHIKNLRQKIEPDSANPIYVLTVRGVGYKFGFNRD
ncbi:MAG: response regulator transcription factor [Clostridiales bacterium]|jgi:DNA-binding response OmpR family regulator|nr:response regulator transcription factor [Clostridiales bacterium]